jgi:phosphoglycolate phosphatase-like HAD superfamily hydrolase
LNSHCKKSIMIVLYFSLKPRTFWTFWLQPSKILSKSLTAGGNLLLQSLSVCNGASPSGKAAGFGPAIQRFESFRPSLIVFMSNTVELKPDALALDFDGVICNGLREYFQISLKAYRQIWPNLLEDCPPDWEDAFSDLRPVVETGWEMPLVLRALHQGWKSEAILADWPTIRSQLVAQENLDWRAIGHQVDDLRDHWIESDLEGWLALHSFYPGVVPQLHHWLKEGLPVFIITTKESRFVRALLAQVGITLPPNTLFGKDCQQPKAVTLRQLKAQGFSDLWFVEDRLATLSTIQSQPDLKSIRLFLANWGYNTEMEREAAIAAHQESATEDLHLITLAQFGASFDQWLHPE